MRNSSGGKSFKEFGFSPPPPDELKRNFLLKSFIKKLYISPKLRYIGFGEFQILKTGVKNGRS